jgi:hypothetical protein
VDAEGGREVVVHLAGVAQAFLVYRENVGADRRGWWADKGCAYLGMFWLAGAYVRRHRWWALPRFLLVLGIATVAQTMVMLVAEI